jgi:tRNA-dihydrouridine synthase 3
VFPIESRASFFLNRRTALQRYKKPANWDLIEQVARSETTPPTIGNGDLLTCYEMKRRMDGSRCLAAMIGRGALIRPWCFQEYQQGTEYHPTAAERVGIYRRFVSYMKEHFGDDAMGRRKAWYFLPWHLGFFARYRPLPESIYGAMSLQQPLISTRWESVACVEMGEAVETLPLLERLLRCEAEGALEAIAGVLWEADSDQDAVIALEGLACSELVAWEEAFRTKHDGRGDERQPEG